MKRRTWLVIGILLGILLLFILLAVFGGPIWVYMGGEPICVQGDLLNLKFVPCPEHVRATVTPLPTPGAGAEPTPLIFDDDSGPDELPANVSVCLRPDAPQLKVQILRAGGD